MVSRNTRVRDVGVSPILGITVKEGSAGGGGGENLLLYSEQFNNWSIDQAPETVVTANNIANPLDASVTADGIDRYSTTGGTVKTYAYQSVSITSGVQYTLSVYAKKDTILATGKYLHLSFDNTNFPQDFALFNLHTGAIQQNPVTAGWTASMSADLGSGWYRCSLTGTSTATGTGNVYIGIGATTGYRTPIFLSANHGIHVYGAQLERGASPGTYTVTTDTIVSGGDPYTGQIDLVNGASGIRLCNDTGDLYWSFSHMTGAGQGFKVEGTEEIWLNAYQTDHIHIYTTGKTEYQLLAPQAY